MEERWREPAALAEQYAGMLYRLAYARTGSRADAEDGLNLGLWSFETPAALDELTTVSLLGETCPLE